MPDISYGCSVTPATYQEALWYRDTQKMSRVDLVVGDQGAHKVELDFIKSLGMIPVIDIEIPIWNGGEVEGTPITNFASYFQALKDAGWEYVSSEGGRNTGDLDFMAKYFKGYINYNCDQCGLWRGMYAHPFTVLNAWEAYYTFENEFIRSGALATKGKPGGLLAGMWLNSNGVNPMYAGAPASYKAMLDWSYQNGVGFTYFGTWGGTGSSKPRYLELGFDRIVASLQTAYLPILVGSAQPQPAPKPQPIVLPVADVYGFCIGLDHALWCRGKKGGVWFGWISLGGYITSVLGQGKAPDGTTHVFVRGRELADGARLFTLSVSPDGKTSAWEDLGGKLLLEGN